jgi:ribA/ribD-fused uncharacterized protein
MPTIHPPPDAITSFRDDYRFLSNFYPSPVEYENYLYPTVEHAYQSLKSLDPTTRKYIASCLTPSGAKYYAKKIPLRPDWNDVKLQIMYDLVYDKFTRHNNLTTKLLATYNRLLIEGNNHNDTYWGAVPERVYIDGNFTTIYKGSNHLGKILMEVREKILPF